jgi:hypothetical protein
MDIEFALDRVQRRLAPGIDSNRASAIVAYHGTILKLKNQLDLGGMSEQGRRATEAMVKVYQTRIDALSREVA